MITEGKCGSISKIQDISPDLDDKVSLLANLIRNALLGIDF